MAALMHRGPDMRTYTIRARRGDRVTGYPRASGRTPEGPPL